MINRAPRRIACPEDTVPVELWAMAMSPNKKKLSALALVGKEEVVKLDVKTDRKGVEEAKVDNTYFKKALHQGLAKIRRTNLTPLRWHKSKGATIRQGLKDKCGSRFAGPWKTLFTHRFLKR